jgi:hypothetical protein
MLALVCYLWLVFWRRLRRAAGMRVNSLTELRITELIHQQGVNCRFLGMLGMEGLLFWILVLLMLAIAPSEHMF